MRNILKQILFIVFLFGTVLCSEAQVYESHIHLANKDVKVQALTKDKEDNLYLMGTTTDALCLTGSRNVEEIPLRMMSYNIQGHIMNTTKLNNLATVINSQNPDVVSIQEVDMAASYITHDWLADLAAATNMKAYFFPTVGEKYGIGLLTKKTPLSVTNKLIERLPESSDKESRGMIIAEYDKFVFIATHYSLNADDRDNATSFIVNYASTATKNVFVAGDMNAQYTYRCIQTFLNSGFKVLNDTSIPTFSSTSPTECIDMILSYTPQNEALPFSVTDRGIPNNHQVDLTTTSDHLPIYVNVKMTRDVTANPDIPVSDLYNKSLFLAKYNKNQELLWYKRLTVTGDVRPFDIQTGNDGKVYIAMGVDGSLTNDSFINGSCSGPMFAILNGNGDLLWHQAFGNQFANDRYAAISPDGQGGFYIGGDCNSSINLGGNALTFEGTGCFIARYSSDGTCIWAKKIEPGSAKNAYMHRIIAGKQNDIYVAFCSNGSDVKVGNLSLSESNITSISAYISRWNESGDAVWFKKFNGFGYKTNAATQRNVSSGPGAGAIPVAVDGQNNVSLLLWTSGMRIEVKNNASSAENTLSDISLGEGLAAAGLVWLKYTSQGKFTSSQRLGNNEIARLSTTEYLMQPSIAVDSKGNNYVGGYTSSDNYLYTTGYQPAGRGKRDFFLARINVANTIDFVRRVGGTQDDCLPAITVSANDNNIYAAIYSESSPAYLGLNLSDTMEGQGASVTEQINSSNVYFTRYMIDQTQSSISSCEKTAPITFLKSGDGYQVMGVTQPVTLHFYSIDGKLSGTASFDSDGWLPAHGKKGIYVVKIMEENAVHTTKILF